MGIAKASLTTPLCTRYYQPQIRMHIRRQVRRNGEETAKRKDDEGVGRGRRRRRGFNFQFGSNEQIVKLEKTFNHPAAHPVSRSFLYLCFAESTVPRGCSTGSRGSPESGLNEIIARISAESFVARKIARSLPNVSRVARVTRGRFETARAMYARLPQTNAFLFRGTGSTGSRILWPEGSLSFELSTILTKRDAGLHAAPSSVSVRLCICADTLHSVDVGKSHFEACQRRMGN